jgi:hypothetical protein
VSRRIPSRPRMLLIASTLIVSVGYAFQVHPAEERIATARSIESVAVGRIARDERALAERKGIDALARNIARQLHGLRASASESTATLLDEFERLGRRDGLVITGIQPASPEPVTASGAPSAESVTLLRDDLEVTARGRFHAALAFLGDLSTLALPTSLSGVDLDRVSGTSSGAPTELEATFRLHAFRLNPTIPLTVVEEDGV